MINQEKTYEDYFRELLNTFDIVSVDIGYGDVKASCGDKRVVFPAVVEVGTLKNNFESIFGGSTKNDNEVDIENMCIEYNKVTYLVGQAAIREKGAEHRLETDRKNARTMLLLNTAIQLVTEGSNKPVILSTGLPLSFFEEEQSALKQYIENKENQQPLKWLSGANVGQTIKTDIHKALVFPQGASAIFTALNNHEGRMNYPKMMFKRSLIALIDIGYRTTDFMVVELDERMTPKPSANLSDSIANIGISNFHDKLIEVFKAETGASSIPSNIMENLLDDGQVYFNKKHYDFNEAIVEIKNDLASKIYNDIFNKWRDNIGFFSGIFLVGGGSILLQESLQAQFKEQDIIRIKEAQFANVIGYSRLSKAILRNNAQTILQGMNGK